MSAVDRGSEECFVAYVEPESELRGELEEEGEDVRLRLIACLFVPLTGKLEMETGQTHLFRFSSFFAACWCERAITKEPTPPLFRVSSFQCACSL